jgi:disulfide bond formation protein DsbB
MKNKANNIYENNKQYLPYAIWFVAAGALIGSLALSEIFDLIPCTLCWWQRTFMFPLAFVATVGVLRKDQNMGYYLLPLAVVGIVISMYHSLLQWGIIKETILDCSLTGAVSCSKPEIMWFGFITIPFMAFVSFSTIAVLSWLSLPNKKV